VSAPASRYAAPELPFVPTSDTSVAAAVAKQTWADIDRQEVLAYLRACGGGGATDDQIQTVLLMDGNTERPRRVELVRLGLVADSTFQRRTRSGHWAAVWVAVWVAR
jgi:hypothetical protein